MSLRVRSKLVVGFLAIGATGLTVLFGAPAGAVPPRAQGQDDAAEQAFHVGVEAAHQERWVDARTAFEQAYGLSPRPVVLINLAGAQVRTGRLTEAAKNYHRILEDPPSPETASFRRAAAEVLPALEARIPRVRLRQSGLSPTDVIRIDGETVSTEALTQGETLDPGEHTLVVQHGSVERARVLFALTERELRYITLPLPSLEGNPRLGAAAIGASTQNQGSSLSAEPSSEPSSERSSRRSWWTSPWTWTAVAVVVAGASIATFAAVQHQDQLFSGNVPPGQISVR